VSVIKSPGSERMTPPSIPEDILTMLELMGLTAVWTPQRRYIIAYNPSGNIHQQELWQYDGAGGHEGWMTTLTFIADHIKAMQLGEEFVVKPKPAPRKIAEELALAEYETKLRAAREAPKKAAAEEQEKLNPFLNAIGVKDGL